jgi:nucleoside-diphosphate kinase
MLVLIFSGPVLAMVLERPDAIAQWRALIGPTDARKAKTSHPNRLETNFFPLTCYGLEYIFYCITVFIVLFVVADSNLCHCFFRKPSNLCHFSIRAMCGLDSEKNCVHGSDSPESAAKEISFFFGEAESGWFLHCLFHTEV